jgi:hypothetical protein
VAAAAVGGGAVVIALIITGTRAQLLNAHRDAIRQAVGEFIKEHKPPDIVIHGGCGGVDLFVAARFEALNQRRERLQDGPPVQLVSMPADWHRHDKAAGPVRNTAMVNLAKLLRDGSTYEVHWLAFPLGESNGTRDCARKCETAGFAGRVVELEVDDA